MANLCAHYNIPCHIISPSDENGSRIDTFNTKISILCNAEFHYCSKQNVKETVEEVIQICESENLHPYYIYVTSSGTGNEHIPLKVYSKAYGRIQDKFDYIFLATGTGMTQGGLVVGRSLHGGREKVIGISIAGKASQVESIIEKSVSKFSHFIHQVSSCEVTVIDSYLAGGYGCYTQGIEHTIRGQIQKNGLYLDPTYTGKAFYGMKEYLNKNKIQGKRILFIHTGGTLLYFDYERGITLHEMSSYSAILNTVVKLEGSLQPPLSERGVSLQLYSKKISSLGKVWCHNDMGNIVFIVAGYFNEGKHTSYLSLLAVSPDYRRKKLAMSLMRQFEDYAASKEIGTVRLEVRKANKTAQAFYNKIGYEICSEASENSFYMINHLRKTGGGKLYC